ncbi:hypothetical protein SODALDRAFT_156920 [Sodiomyces alkalinus F11]|uniref:Lytic polysaccharide monooxygenase n=1 Tax=Sodiomyces alkalinus (strain CBS 110278 / VKM F-3762 / F11) TaxID=1314773 RepID=A0A3N2PY29_SODAK|nr:hypothetical protein SODALDRAFT_156920 [Sodiomyces alkalinus F11]ROT39316.1 hypothetical protein SODALDRAFT_156920 [Sodiomyces alkalinus F11]
MLTKTLVLGSLAALASAHIKVSSPEPYGASNLDNSPLLPDGADFPCKQRIGVYDVEGASNVYALGSTGHPLAFVGSAVHGGGSCQVSITYDARPDKNSVWKVIKSIEGGCPAQGQEGNMGSNANQEVPYKYNFDIPSDIPAGNGTIAWTWFNKVGNREMYMNCGPVTLEGQGGSQEAYNALPDMFVANLEDINDCRVPAGVDVVFPSPGSRVERLNGPTNAFGTPDGEQCKPTGSPGGGNGNGGGAPAPTVAPPTTEAPAPTPTGDAGSDDRATLPGGIFIPVLDTTTPYEGPQPTSAPDTGYEPEPIPEPVPGPAPIPEPEAPVPVPAPSEPAGDGVYAPGTPCSEEGQWNCIGGDSFQRCASGNWSTVIQLAAGTNCEPGQGADINMIVTRNGRKRALRKTSVVV